MMMPDTVDHKVELYPDELDVGLARYRGMLNAQAADLMFDDTNLPNVKLRVNGKDQFASFHSVLFGTMGQVNQVILEVEASEGMYWYVIPIYGAMHKAAVSRILFAPGDGEYRLIFVGREFTVAERGDELFDTY